MCPLYTHTHDMLYVSIHNHKLPTIVRVHHVWWIPIFLEETSDTPKALICLRVTFDERSDRRFRRCCEKMGLPVLEHHIARWFAENQVSSVQNPGRFIVTYWGVSQSINRESLSTNEYKGTTQGFGTLLKWFQWVHSFKEG